MAPTHTVRFDGEHLPVWHGLTGSYIDPATGEVPPTWDQALDAIGEHDAPPHVARFGAKFDAQGVLAGSKELWPVHPLPDMAATNASRRSPRR